MTNAESARTWTIADAKAHLSAVLRLAEEEGPQRIGIKKTFVVVSLQTWRTLVAPTPELGKWLVENMPRGLVLPVPNRAEPERRNPFVDEDDA